MQSRTYVPSRPVPSHFVLISSYNEKLLTRVDIANRLQINKRTVTQWLRKRHLRGFKCGKEWRVSEKDLEAFLEASANKPSSNPRPVA